MTRPFAQHRQLDQASGAALAYLSVFVLVLLLFPSAAVLPGALKSNGSPAVLLSLAAFGIVILNLAAGRHRELAASGPALLAIVAALEFTTWAAGYVTPHDAVVAAGVTRGLLDLIGYTGISMLAMFTMRHRDQRRRLMVVLVIGLCYDGVVGILQNVHSLNERLLLVPPGFVLNRGFKLAIRDGHPRATGTADSPIEYALLMALLVGLSLYLIRREHGSGTRIVGAVGFGVGIIGIPASVSRTGLVALAAVVLIYLTVTRLRNFAGAILVVGLLMVAFVVAFPRLADQLTALFTQASTDDSIKGRTSDYPVVFSQFRMHPWFGTGLGSNPAYQTRFLDNEWLQAMIEGGTVGVAALVVLFLAAAAAGGGAIRSARTEVERREGVALLATLLAVFTSSFTFDLYAFNQAKFVFFLLFGLTWAALAERRAADQAMESNGFARATLRTVG